MNDSLAIATGMEYEQLKREYQKVTKVLRELVEHLEDAEVTFNSNWESNRAEQFYEDITREARALAWPRLTAKDWADIERDIKAARTA